MGTFSLTHWVVVAIVVLVLFGRGRISATMADFGKGIGSFRRSLAEDVEAEPEPAQIAGSKRPADTYVASPAPAELPD